MKAVIFSGTTEGRKLSLALAAEGADVIVSVASDMGAEEQGTAEGVTVSTGLKDEAEIRQLIRGADVVIDATHPYAVLVTENVRRAAEAEGIELLRLIRDRSELVDETAGRTEADGSRPAIRIAADAADAARLAKEIAGADGHVLLTTGSKDLPIYAAVLDPEHLYARVLPLIGSIEACEAAQIPHRNIIAIQGPFSEELNRAVLRDYDIDVMVTKESGRTGGFLEKIRACEAAGIPAIVIARPAEEGLSFEAVLAACRERMRR